MVKGLILLANGFEDTEAITTIDILRRAKIELDLVSVSDNLEIMTQSKIMMKAEKLLKDLNLSEYDFLVIPGGGAVFNVLSKLVPFLSSFCKQPQLLDSPDVKLDPRTSFSFPQSHKQCHIT